MANDENGKVVPEDDVKVDSFKAYPSSEDDKTRIVNGEKQIEDFHMYESSDDEEDNEEEDEEDDKEDEED